MVPGKETHAPEFLPLNVIFKMPSAKLIFHDIEDSSKSYRPKGALRIFILELPDIDFQDCSAVIGEYPSHQCSIHSRNALRMLLAVCNITAPGIGILTAVEERCFDAPQSSGLSADK